ncbi:MAG: hypothetical protein NVSMB39_1890 [Candidatus Saccharimonadales bacterium]
MTPHSELSWKLADYLTAGQEPPARIVSNRDATEGEMMSDDELEEYLKDSIATMRILLDKRSPRFEDLVANYVADLTFLMSIGRIAEDDYNELTDPDNLRF